jgi:hypothetical protein
MTGQSALKILDSLVARVELHQKDNTDKFWSYKLKTGRFREFAFDPNTSTRLIIRSEVEPPSVDGIERVENIQGKSVSTALSRVFSGDKPRANYKATITTEDGLMSFLSHLERY